MNCPNKKHRKPVNLIVKRTLKNGGEVRRQSWCPKCKQFFWTVQKFETDIKDQEAAHKKEKEILQEKIWQLERKIRDWKDIFSELGRAIKEAGK